MEVKSEMYTKLFNEMTEIEKELQKLIERMKSVQMEVEEMYINEETGMWNHISVFVLYHQIYSGWK